MRFRGVNVGNPIETAKTNRKKYEKTCNVSGFNQVIFYQPFLPIQKHKHKKTPCPQEATRPTHPLRQGEKRKNGSLLTYCKAKRHPQPPKGGFHIRRKASPNPGNLSRCNREGGFTTRLRGCEAFRQKGRTPFRQKGRTPLGKRSVPL